MKKKNFLIVLLLVIIILIITVVSFVYLSSVKINNKNSLLYGTWVADSSEIYKDGLIILVNENITNHYIEIDEEKINVCYIVDGNNNCNYYGYTVSDNIISVEENDDYLSGELSYNIESKMLNIEKKSSKPGMSTVFHYVKE